MICNALYIKQCYGGFNVYITQISLCLGVFKAARLPSPDARCGFDVFVTPHTPGTPNHSPSPFKTRKKINLPQFAPGGSFPYRLFFKKKINLEM